MLEMLFFRGNMKEINKYKVVIGDIEINGYSKESEIPSSIIEIENLPEVIKSLKEMVNGKSVTNKKVMDIKDEQI